MNTEIVRIPSERRSEAAAVLAAAFAADEQFSKFFPRIDASHRDRLACLFSWACELHSAFSMPFFGAVQGDQLVGVAAVQEASSYRSPSFPVRLWRRLRDAVVSWRVGLRASRRMKEYSKVVASLRPAPPFHYVSYIGVLSEVQGEGVRDRLLAAAYRLACEDSSSHGLVLDTFNPQFARSLEAQGWAVSGPAPCGQILGYSLFRRRAV
jgi:hypothetical protein